MADCKQRYFAGPVKDCGLGGGRKEAGKLGGFVGADGGLYGGGVGRAFAFKPSADFLLAHAALFGDFA